MVEKRGRGRPKAEVPLEWEVLQVRLDPDTAKGLDDMRRAHPDIPPRAVLVREMVAAAVAKDRAKRRGPAE